MSDLQCGCRNVHVVGHRATCPITVAARETGVFNPSDFPRGLPDDGPESPGTQAIRDMPESEYTPEPEDIEVIRELIELEQNGARSTVSIGPFTSYLLVGVIQAATRGDMVTGRQRQVLRNIGEQLAGQFGGLAAELLARGWSPEFDVPRDQ